MFHQPFCGLSREHLGELVTELAPQWEARCESGRRQRRRGDRRRQAGAGPKYALMFSDRQLVTLVHLRTGLTYEALGVIYQVGSSTIGRPIGEMRPLRAERGFAVPQRPGLRGPNAGSPSRNDQACACTPWPTCSPTPRPNTSHCGSTVPKPRSVGRRPDAPDGPPSSPASANRTRSRPPSATAKDDRVVWGGAAGPDARPDHRTRARLPHKWRGRPRQDGSVWTHQSDVS